MQDFEKLGSFYLGRTYDPIARESRQDLMLYDAKDLVTHAVCVGMTGSGKTGLCIGLLEEAAIDGIPALIIDPKGDLGNLLLQFPDLKPEDFRPWINEDDARREGKTPDEFAAGQAELWANGLAKWGQSGERIRKLQASSDLAVYTPGSSAGLSLSILKSFSAPEGAAAEDPELVADRVASAATAVLSLAGFEDADPLSSREHILISNLLHRAWSEGEDLGLAGLIGQIQQPPMKQVGVVDVDSFFPAKDRFALAMRINNLLASPGFAAWMEGEPLDIQRLLYTAEGKPRLSILSIAHLSDSERMFFVSLLLNEVLTWTRSQPGTTSLRAIIYMDEIFGYFPPSANPPSKKPLLTLLKQARAFGVGVMLATQNPVDLDYKGLANCGTWFIGRLQTERDKDRLLEGLEGASSGAFDRGQMERILAGLGKRVFLMNNVHDSGPVAFETRWCLSYLRGPLTRSQIKELMNGRRTAQESFSQASGPLASGLVAAPRPTMQGSADARPVLPVGIQEAFLALRGNTQDVRYQPSLLAAVQIRYTDAKAAVDHSVEKYFLTPIKDDNLPVQWPEEAVEVDVHPEELEPEPAAIPFGLLPSAASKPKSYAAWNKDLVTWIFGSQALTLYRAPSVKLISQAGESEGDFRARVQVALREHRDAAVEKLKQKYAPKFQVLQERLRRAEAAKAKEEAEASAEKWGLAITVGQSILGAVLGRKPSVRSSARGVAGAAKAWLKMQKGSADVERAEDTVESVRELIGQLDQQFAGESEAVARDFDPAAAVVEPVGLKPMRTNIQVRYFGLVWAPYRNEDPAW
jgi:hypothetical protein